MRRYYRLFFSFFLFPFSFPLLHAQQGNWLWASYGTDGKTDIALSQNMVATDNAGNCFYTGFLSDGAIKFGPYTLWNIAPNYYAIFLVKFDPNGSVVWAKQSLQNGNAAIGNGYVVSTDAMGNAYIMANFTDTLFFDSYTLTTQPEINNFHYDVQDNFLVKYDPNGNALWAKQSATPSYHSYAAGNSLATDKKGNSYITGLFLDTISFGTKILTQGPTFLVKYDANGNVIWAAQSTGHSAYGSEGDAVAVNNANGVFIAGKFEDKETFGSFKLSSPLSIGGNTYIVKYDTNGNVLWAKQGVIPSIESFAIPRGLTADNFGNVYLTGLFRDTVVFAKDTLTSVTNDIFLVKYDANGNEKWAMTAKILDNNDWGPTSLSTDNNGDIFMAGGGGGQGLCKICFGTDTLSLIEKTDTDAPSFIVKFDSSGKVLCASVMPCAGGTWNGVASDPSGNYVYFGSISNINAIFDEDTIRTTNGATPFIARWQECEPTLSINEIKGETEEVKVYPNPNNGQFTLSLSNVNTTCNVEVYNVLGEQVYQSNINSDNTKINLSGQPNGVYLYRVISQEGNLVGEGKIVKQ